MTSSFGPAAIMTTTSPTPPTGPVLTTIKGEVVHPQHWPEDINLTGKKVIVIGSGGNRGDTDPEYCRRLRTYHHVTALRRPISGPVPTETRWRIGCGCSNCPTTGSTRSFRARPAANAERSAARGGRTSRIYQGRIAQGRWKPMSVRR